MAGSRPQSEQATTVQLHLLGQLLPDGLQGAGSVGRAGQQLPEAGPFIFTARMEGAGQHPGLALLGHPTPEHLGWTLEWTGQAKRQHREGH